MDKVIDNLRRLYGEMFSAEKKVADLVLNQPQDVINMSISELARVSNTSDATIIRMCKRIGYTGYYQMKISLATEFGRDQVIDRGSFKKAPKDVVDFFDFVSATIFQASKNVNNDILNACVNTLSNANMVYFVAWGNTMAVAEDFAHRLSRCGIKTFISETPEYLIRNISFGCEKDVLVALSHSGTSIHVIQNLELANERNMKTILITNTKDSKAAEISDYVLSAEIKEQFFFDFGAASHIIEMLIVDALIYFLLNENETFAKRADQAEVISSQYKL